MDSRNTITFAFLTLALAASCSQRPGGPPDPSTLNQQDVDEVVARMQSHVPSGWTMERDGYRIVFTKTEPVVFYCGQSMVSRRSGQDERAYYAEHGVERQLAVELRVGTRLSYSEYGLWLRARAGRVRKAEALREALADVPFSKSYEPRNPEERKKVEEYQHYSFNIVTEAKPVFHTGGATIYLSTMMSCLPFDHRDCCLVHPVLDLWEAKALLRDLEREFAAYDQGNYESWYFPVGALYVPIEYGPVLIPKRD
jgi:hypothetical protein